MKLRKTAEEIRALTDSFRDALLETHHKVTWTASRLPTQKRRKFEKHNFPNFEIHDFVLLAAPENQFPPKLGAKWTGPYRVAETVSNYVDQVEDLVRGAKETAHISKLRFYSHASLGITEEVKDHIGLDENQEQLVSKV